MFMTITPNLAQALYQLQVSLQKGELTSENLGSISLSLSQEKTEGLKQLLESLHFVLLFNTEYVFKWNNTKISKESGKGS